VPKLLTIAVACTGLLVAGCGGDDDSSDSASTTAAETTEATAPAETQPAGGDAKGTAIKAGDSQCGQVIFDGDDQAIYYFDTESGSKSECDGACAEARPPVLTDGDPPATGGANANLLGTTERTDGTTQVTYDGHPVYYYAHEGPGAVTCHNVDEFGGLWLAVEPSGEAVS
jgi:predicted lipoprotein with Yx(FWY)xxD motif